MFITKKFEDEQFFLFENEQKINEQFPKMHNFKNEQISKSEKNLKSEQISKMNNFRKWTNFENKQNLKMNNFPKWTNFRNEQFLKMNKF